MNRIKEALIEAGGCRQLCKSTQNAETELFSKKSVPVTGVTRW